MQGIVKWFDDMKGYGFILFENKEAFVHFREIDKKGYRTLYEGDKVEIGKIVKTPKGFQALKVKRLV